MRTILALGPVASLLLVQAAPAQTGACDQLKTTLAARIDPGIRGYALEAVPAGVPVPPGAKVIGNCEGGARKILFFRSGGAPQPSLDAASAVVPAALPRASAASEETKRPVIQAPSTPPTPAAQTVAITSASIDKPQVGASAVGAVPSLPESNAAAHVAVASASVAQQASEFLGRHWVWLAALGFLLIGGSLWAWLAHHSAYDATGLPRGPRIN
jgi:hypothetical protein